MALGSHDQLACSQAVTAGQRSVDRFRAVDTRQPFFKHGLQRSIMQAQPGGQPGQAGAARIDCRRAIVRVKRQLGWRRILAECAYRLEPTDFERTHALAQRRFERVLPTLFDLQAGPQTRQAFQTMARQPGLQLAFGLDFFLQRTQGIELGGQLRAARQLAVGFLLLDAACFFKQRQLFRQLVQLGGLQVAAFVSGMAGTLQVNQSLRVGRRQRLALDRQAFTAAAQLARLIFDAAAFGRQHLDLLLHLHDFEPLRVGSRLCCPERIFSIGQILPLLVGLGGEDFTLLLGHADLLGNALLLVLRFQRAGFPLLVLRLQINQPRLDPLPAFDDIADAFLEPADFELRLGITALRGMQLVASSVMRLAQRFQPGLDLAQLGQAGFQRIDRVEMFLPDPGLLAGGVAVFQEPELLQLERAAVLQTAIG